MVFLLLVPTGHSFGQSNNFQYLKIDKNIVKTTHSAKYTIVIDRSFRFLGHFNHQPTYGDKQFNVSFAAYTDGVNLIMIHAEKHTDGSGGLDYSDLTPAVLNKLKFTMRDQCATKEDDEEMDSNPQIQVIRSVGFDLKTPFFLRQFFATSKSGDAEVVISYGRKVDKCSEFPSEFIPSIVREINEKIKVKR